MKSFWKLTLKQFQDYWPVWVSVDITCKYFTSTTIKQIHIFCFEISFIGFDLGACSYVNEKICHRKSFLLV
jgi:hypothetical protein